MEYAAEHRVKNLLREGALSNAAIAQRCGVSKSAVDRVAQKMKREVIETVAAAKQILDHPKFDVQIPIVEGIGPGEIEFIKDENPKTLDDLIRICEIDLNQFEIVSFEVNKWEVGVGLEEVYTEKNGALLKAKEKIETKPLFQIKVRLKPRSLSTRVSAVELMSRLAENINGLDRFPLDVEHINLEYSSSVESCTRDKLFELDLMDLHFGKYCWGEESVTDFDLSIAARLFRKGVQDLFTRAQRHGFNRTLMVIGNDVLHIDSPKGQTFAGTPMDYDGRFTKIFEKVHQLHSWAIRYALVFGPVDVMMVQGNHDTVSSWHLGHVLETEFRTYPCTFNNAPRARKYYAYGKNLIGFTHGDKGKEADLPLQMAREVPDLWAKAEYREIHRGHLHKYSETKWRASESYAGITVRTLNTLTAHDKWHTDEGYMDRRGMQGFLFDKERGLEAMLQVNVVHSTGEIA